MQLKSEGEVEHSIQVMPIAGHVTGIPANHCLPKVSRFLLLDSSFAPSQAGPINPPLHSPFQISLSLLQLLIARYPCGVSFTMEYHAVPPEERARDEQGNLLPWGYVYKE